jgi:Cu2+-exporting ATPase
MMVGDGVNDAAVLSTADVSFAMAGATPLARLQSDALLMKDSLGLILLAHRTALRTRRVIRQNLIWAAAYNISVIPFAAMGWVPPWLAAIGMSASSLLVMLNAMRLTRVH